MGTWANRERSTAGSRMLSRLPLAFTALVIFSVGMMSDPDIRGALLNVCFGASTMRSAQDLWRSRYSAVGKRSYHRADVDVGGPIVRAVRYRQAADSSGQRGVVGASLASAECSSHNSINCWPGHLVSAALTPSTQSKLRFERECIPASAQGADLAGRYGAVAVADTGDAAGRAWRLDGAVTRIQQLVDVSAIQGAGAGQAELLWMGTFHRPWLRESEPMLSWYLRHQNGRARRLARDPGTALPQGKSATVPARGSGTTRGGPASHGSGLSDDSYEGSLAAEPWDVSLFAPWLPLFVPWTALALEFGSGGEADKKVQAMAGLAALVKTTLRPSVPLEELHGPDADDPIEEPAQPKPLATTFVTVLDVTPVCPKGDAACVEPASLANSLLSSPELSELLAHTVVVEYCGLCDQAMHDHGAVGHSCGCGPVTPGRVRMTGGRLIGSIHDHDDSTSGGAASEDSQGRGHSRVSAGRVAVTNPRSAFKAPEDWFVQRLHAWLANPAAADSEMVCHGASEGVAA